MHRNSSVLEENIFVFILLYFQKEDVAYIILMYQNQIMKRKSIYRNYEYISFIPYKMQS